ncbi:hypothetical protein [Anaerovibrio sp.]|uniref:hypothetical protein n=1 Tax=Anaerovibrio sp. TaxID=1872532 RepID=UPI00388ED338
MKKFSKRYAKYVTKKSMKYVGDHKADFIRLGIMTGVVLFSNDSCFAKEIGDGGTFSSMMKPLTNAEKFVTDVVGPLLFGGGLVAVGGGLIKGDSRDIVGKGVAVAGGGGVMMNADTLIGTVGGCLM